MKRPYFLRQALAGATMLSVAGLADALAAGDPSSAEWFELATYKSALLPEFMVQK
jgi:hypothetical protein